MTNSFALHNPIQSQQIIRCLALDSATSCLTIALLENGHLCDQVQVWTERNHAVVLVPHMQELFAKHTLRIADMHAIAVGRGPGSYTGVRIATSIVKTLAWANQLQLLGVSTLAAIAKGAYRKYMEKSQFLEVNHERTWVIPLVDARRGQAFTGLYQFTRSQEKIEEIVSDQIQIVENWLNQIASKARLKKPDHILIVTEAQDLSIRTELQPIEEFVQQLNWLSIVPEEWKSVTHVNWISHAVEAYDIGKLAMPRILANETDEIHRFVPNYTQLPEAEVKRIAKSMKGADEIGGRSAFE